MAITLERICANCEKTYEMKQLAGKNSMDKFVRWVHMVEDLDVPDFLHGNELIFTTGIAQKGTNWLLDFVKNLHGNNVSGIVLNLGPYIESVPPQVIVFCEKNNLPLFTIPWKMRLVDVIYDFCHRIVASEETEIGLVSAFKNTIFSPDDDSSYKSTLERRGFHKDGKYTVTAFTINDDKMILQKKDLRSLILLANRILNKLGVLHSIFFQERKLILIVQNCGSEKLKRFCKSFHDSVSENFPSVTCFAGIGPTLTGYHAIAEAYYKALSTVSIATMHEVSLMDYDNLGIYKLLISVEDTSVLKDFYNETLASLEEYDNLNNSDYTETLRFYLIHNFSVQEVAKLTGVHRNTINNKIKRIKEILRNDLDGEGRLKLMLAFYIRGLLY